MRHASLPAAPPAPWLAPPAAATFRRPPVCGYPSQPRQRRLLLRCARGGRRWFAFLKNVARPTACAQPPSARHPIHGTPPQQCMPPKNRLRNCVSQAAARIDLHRPVLRESGWPAPCMGALPLSCCLFLCVPAQGMHAGAAAPAPFVRFEHCCRPNCLLARQCQVLTPPLAPPRAARRAVLAGLVLPTAFPKNKF